MAQNRRLLLVLLACAAAATAARADDAKLLRWEPDSHLFYCDIPSGWTPFEEPDPAGTAVHIIGPDAADGTYRAGIDIRWIDSSQPGFLPAKKLVDVMRRSDKTTGRDSTTIHPMRIGGVLGRTFEVSETRRFPPDGLPTTEETLHEYVAVVPSGQSYFLVTLSSTRESYLDYRQLFIDFLHSFKPAGYR